MDAARKPSIAMNAIQTYCPAEALFSCPKFWSLYKLPVIYENVQ